MYYRDSQKDEEAQGASLLQSNPRRMQSGSFRTSSAPPPPSQLAGGPGGRRDSPGGEENDDESGQVPLRLKPRSDPQISSTPSFLNLAAPRLVLSPLTRIMSDASRDDVSEEFWCEDGDLTDAPDDALSHTSALNREWKLRHEQFHKMGYREGITQGKKASAQEGFNAGFKQSVHAGYKWGLVRGVSSVLANLSHPLKEKLTGTTDNMEKVQSLHESAQAISTAEALKLFYDSLQKTEQSHDRPEGDFHACFMTNKELGYNQLDILVKDLTRLLETPESKVKVQFDK